MKIYIDAVKIVKNKNDRYDVYNYTSSFESKIVGFNMPLDMAKKEVERIKGRLLRQLGTTKIFKEI